MIVIVLLKSLYGHFTNNRTHVCLRKGQRGSLILDSKCSNWMKNNSICNAKESLCCMERQETGIHITKLQQKVGMKWIKNYALLLCTISYCRTHMNRFIQQVLLPQHREVDLQSPNKTRFWIKMPETESVKSNKWHLSCWKIPKPKGKPLSFLHKKIPEFTTHLLCHVQNLILNHTTIDLIFQ